MKSLQEIINRNDYVNANKALVSRASEIAVLIRNKMEELDFEEGEVFRFGSKDNEIRLSLAVFRERSLNYSEVHLCYYQSYSYGYAENLALDIERSYNLNCGTGTSIKRATYKQFCHFLNMANTILQELDETETQLVEQGKKALENSVEIAK